MEIYPIDLAIHVVNILVLYVLLRLLLFKPVKKFLNKRQERVAAEMNEASSAREEAEKEKAEYDAKLANAKTQCDAILADGYKESQEHAQSVVDEAKHEAENLMEQARLEAQEYKQKVMDAAKDELADIAVDMAGRVLRFDEETKKHIVSGNTAKVGRKSGVLKLAIQAGEQEISAITAKLEAILGTQLDLTVEVDESLIGGYAAFVDGKVYDFSYAAQLDSMKRKLS